MIKVSAPGKIHLSGEHSVVYNEPALLSAIDKRIYLELEKNDTDNNFVIRDLEQDIEEKKTFSEIKAFSEKNIEVWLKSDKLGLIKAGIAEIFKYLNKKSDKGFIVSVKSQIPIGVGLGSSAALSVCLAAAFLKYFDKWSLNEINKIAHLIEKRQHGNPSGGDNTVSTYGEYIYYIKNKEIQKFNGKTLKDFYILNSGRPLESTGEMVGLVSKNLDKKVIKKIGEITVALKNAIEKKEYKKIEKLIKENEKLLEEIGVVGEKAKKIIRKIEKNQGFAKICGAGGIKRGSGIILAYKPDIDSLNMEFEKVKLGVKGVRIEKS